MSLYIEVAGERVEIPREIEAQGGEAIERYLAARARQLAGADKSARAPRSKQSETGQTGQEE